MDLTLLQAIVDAQTILLGISGGATFAAAFYFRVRWKGPEVTPFDPFNFGTTVGLGGVLGGGIAVLGIAPTFETITWGLMAFGGVVMLVEACLKALVRGEHALARKHGRNALTSAVGVLLGMGRSVDEMRESVTRGGQSVSVESDAELQERWDGVLADEESLLQVDDVDEDEDGSAGGDSGGDEYRGGTDEPELAPA